MAARRDIELLLKARDEATAEIRGVSEAIEQLGRKVDEQARIQERGVAAIEKSWTEARSKIELVSEGVEIFAGVARAGMAALEGDIEAVASALERMPVFGRSFKAGQDLRSDLMEFVGLESDRQKLEAIEAQVAAIERRNDLMTAALTTSNELADTAARIRRELQIAELDAFDQQRARIVDETTRQIEAIEERVREIQQSAVPETLKVRTTREGSEAIRAIEARERERLEAIDRIEREAAEVERAAIDERERQLAEVERAAAERRAAEIESVESEIRERRLRLEGRTLDAELERLGRHFDERVERAREAGDNELAERLRALEAVREEEARARDRAIREREAEAKLADADRGLDDDRRDHRGTIGAFTESRFLIGGGGGLPSHVQRQLDETQRTRQAIEDLGKTMKEVSSKLDHRQVLEVREVNV
ncbi:MAG: hypothetical protein ACF8PN_06765 [Phycisphaerales bacterium]